MNIVRWGILSTANINRLVIPAITASKRGKLIAVASRGIDKAQSYASTWNIPVSFGSYEAMLDSDLIDAVYISLPNHMHAEWSIRAMNAGKHVLCEKPITLSTVEIEQVMETRAKTGRVLSEAFMYMHHPQAKTALSWIKEGKLGEVFAVRAVFNFIMNRPGDIRGIREFGGGSLWDVGVYPVSFANMVFKEIPEFVQGLQSLGNTGVDEIFSGSLFYSNNRYAQISCSFQSPSYSNTDILGTQGVLQMTRPFINLDSPERKLTYISKDGKSQEISIPDEYLYTGEIEDMHSAILDSKPSYYSLEESKRNIKTILALYASASQNCARMPLSDE
jgi:xylose dehydrogenase (NAD/NADP)